MRIVAVIGIASVCCFSTAIPQAKPEPKPVPPPIYPMVPQLTSSSAIVIDANTGKVLFAKDAETPRFPASTTKIMTALLLCEKLASTEFVSAPVNIETVGEASLHLRPSERISAEDALYALMLRSANDVAHSVAIKISGTEVEFAKLMNQRAKEIGCKGTTFFNPHGLNHPYHKTTAHDLALIAREALKNQRFAVACSTKTKWIQRSLNQGDLFLKSKNRFLEFPGAIGVKTGYTKPAGHCYVGAMDLGGWKIITVVLNSQDWLNETKLMCDWVRLNFENRILISKNSVVGSVELRDGELPTVKGVLANDLSSIEPKSSVSTNPTIQMFNGLVAPVSKGQKIGHAILGDLKVPIIASENVLAKPPINMAIAGLGGISGIAAILVLSSFAIRAGSNKKKKRYRRA